MRSSALVVEDQDLMRQMLMGELKSVLIDGVVHAAGTLDSALALCRNNDFDLVLIDPGLPGVRANVEVGQDSPSLKRSSRSVPQAIHIVITGSDERSSRHSRARSSVPTPMSRRSASIATACERSFPSYPKPTSTCRVSETRSLAPEFLLSRPRLSREQAIIDFMFHERRGMKGREAYAAIGTRFGITTDSAEKYYKRARAKLIRRGLLVGGN